MPVDVNIVGSGLPDYYHSEFITSTLPWTVNHQDRQYLYIFSNIAIILTFGEYGTIVIPQNQWTFIPYPDGIKIIAPTYPNGITIITLATNNILSIDAQPRVGLNAYERVGQAYISSIIPHVVAVAFTASILSIAVKNSLKTINLLRATVSHNASVSTLASIAVSNVYAPLSGTTNFTLVLSRIDQLVGSPFGQTVTVSSTNPGSSVGFTLGNHTVYINPNTPIDLLQGDTLIIGKGGTGIIDVQVQLPDTTSKATITLVWDEEA